MTYKLISVNIQQSKIIEFTLYLYVRNLNLNLIRLILGFAFLSTYTYFARGLFFPADATQHAWVWLSVSGFVGFVLGDLFLFRAFILIGARVSMLLMALVPPFTTLFGWLVMGETLTLIDFSGMTFVVGGIALVVLNREKKNGNSDNESRKIKLNLPISGLLLAIGGAVGQAGGLVLSKFGMGNYDAFAATQIRVLTGIFGFIILFIILNRWNKLWAGLRDKKGMAFTAIGSFFGPFLGVAFSLLAVQHTKAGIASTIMAIVPVLIIPPSIIIYKERINIKEIIGAILSVCGVALLFIS